MDALLCTDDEKNNQLEQRQKRPENTENMTKKQVHFKKAKDLDSAKRIC